MNAPVNGLIGPCEVVTFGRHPLQHSYQFASTCIRMLRWMARECQEHVPRLQSATYSEQYNPWYKHESIIMRTEPSCAKLHYGNELRTSRIGKEQWNRMLQTYDLPAFKAQVL